MTKPTMTIPPPCPVCGRTYYQGFAPCWRDPAHGKYYSDLRIGKAEPLPPWPTGAPS